MQYQKTVFQEHLQIFAKDVRSRVVCLWGRRPSAQKDSLTPQQQAAHFGSPKDSNFRFPMQSPAFICFWVGPGVLGNAQLSLQRWRTAQPNLAVWQ